MIQNSCLQISIVDIPSTSTSIHHIHENDDHHNTNNTTNNENQIIQSLSSSSTTNTISIASWSISNIIIHCYTLSTLPPEPEEIDDLNTTDGSDPPITVCDVLHLPHQSLHTSWENLIYPQYIKDNIIGYAESSLLFSTKFVSSHIISWNRVLLLHGPPGTGKTSLCRSLAHKLSIRLNHIYTNGGYLIEIQSHSLFSKWFSESGKLISKLFDRIKEMVEDEPNSLFCVLIDEVESLASSRVGGGGGGDGGSAEPSDAVRAVNSVLTSLDSIRSYTNVLVLTTTNITSSIDDAFVDRVDLKQYIGYPCLEARYEILKSCIDELVRVGIIIIISSSSMDTGVGTDTDVVVDDHDYVLKSFKYASAAWNEEQSQTKERNNQSDDLKSSNVYDETKESSSSSSSSSCHYEKLLLQCAMDAKDLSGRSLRKIPFQSHAFFVRSLEGVDLNTFMISLKQGIEKEKRSRGDLNGSRK